MAPDRACCLNVQFNMQSMTSLVQGYMIRKQLGIDSSINFRDGHMGICLNLLYKNQTKLCDIDRETLLAISASSKPNLNLTRTMNNSISGDKIHSGPCFT